MQETKSNKAEAWVVRIAPLLYPSPGQILPCTKPSHIMKCGYSYKLELGIIQSTLKSE